MNAWRALSPEQRMAAAAAAGLAGTLLLPWYTKDVFEEGRLVSGTLSAFGVFTFVEAAVLLVAAAVLYLLWARGQRKGFHLPGGDGTAIMAAGVWTMVLLTWRVFDRPDVEGAAATMGITWGFFFAYTAAGFLALAGARLRAARVPEPPNPAETEVMEPPPRPRPGHRRRRPPVAAESITKVLDDPPEWKGEPPQPPERAKPVAPSPRTPTDPDPEREGSPPDRLF
jgi:hypothetical protein